jgi:hypothetical protein
MRQIDPFEINMVDMPDEADMLTGSSPIDVHNISTSASKIPQSTMIAHYNKLDGIKSILHDMRLKLNAELKQKDQTFILDELYIAALCDLIASTSALQKWLPWDPCPKVTQ